MDALHFHMITGLIAALLVKQLWRIGEKQFIRPYQDKWVDFIGLSFRA